MFNGVDLGCHNHTVSKVPPSVLSGALSRLEGARLPWEGVTPGQIKAIFTMLGSQQLGGSKLKNLYFGFGDISGLSAELILGAIRRLEKIGFIGTTLWDWGMGGDRTGQLQGR